MAYNQGNFTNSRGHSIYYREWPSASQPKAILVWHHGYGCHSTVAERSMSRIRDSGVSVFALDADSFGRSCPDPSKRSLVGHKNDMPDDVFTFVQEVVSKKQGSPRVPLFLGGLSMGGMVTILTAIHHPELFKGILLASPAVDVERDLPLRVLSFLKPLLLRICPNARLVPAIPVENATPLVEEQQRLKNDPLVDTGNIRMRTADMFLTSWDEIRQREKELQLPICIAYSSTDKIVYAPAIERLLKNVQSKDVTVHRLKDAMHDLLLTPEEQERNGATAQACVARASYTLIAGMAERSQGPALRVRLRSKLLGLEDKDVREQIDRELQKLYINLKGSQELDQGLKELFSSIDSCNATARKLRYRLCATLLQSHSFEDFGNSVPFLYKHLEQRGAVEDQAPAVAELAGIVAQFTNAVLEQHSNDQANGVPGPPDPCWLHNLVLRQLLVSACRLPSKVTAGTSFTLVLAALTAFESWQHLDAVMEATRECLVHVLKFVATASPKAQVAESYQLLRSSINLLGAFLEPQIVAGLLKACLKWMKLKDDWQVRKAALETLAALAAALQAAGAESEGLNLLAAEKSKTLVALADAKYDKIVHVRQAANKAISLVEQVPDPLRVGRAPAALQPPAPEIAEQPSLTGLEEETPKAASSKPGRTPGTPAPAQNRPLPGIRTPAQSQKPALADSSARASFRRSIPSPPSPRSASRSKLKQQHGHGMDFGVMVFAKDPPPKPIPLPATPEEIHQVQPDGKTPISPVVFYKDGEKQNGSPSKDVAAKPDTLDRQASIGNKAASEADQKAEAEQSKGEVSQPALEGEASAPATATSPWGLMVHPSWQDRPLVPACLRLNGRALSGLGMVQHTRTLSSSGCRCSSRASLDSTPG
ncbi:hypothetical protein WJX73_002203 [Symbiochloris irregularis]|uniref:Serine aminopeptidase S33 domain-containing protein n=1 Tax=Symbiochloris irregularis TaxID=706552 RepID=A0AAW1PBP7_9CHLO